MNQQDVVLKVIDEVAKISGNPCKKKIQKLIYLIEEKNVNLKFDYKIYMYGPYSEDLDFTICELKAENYLDITYTNQGHILRCKKNIVGGMTQEMEFVIRTFASKTPLELELLTTALYADRHLTEADDQAIMKAVKRIKGKKFSDKKIKDAINLLRKTGYIAA